MIVIASHDNIDLLSNILQDLTKCNLYGHEVLIVDTNSSNKDYLKGFAELIITYPNFKFERKAYTCWDSGAYLHAFKNYYSDKYIFLQDSLNIINSNIFEEITNKLDNTDVLGLFNFYYVYDSKEQQDWVEEGINFKETPIHGIFGPIFSTTRLALEKIPSEWFREPKTKWQGNGMERRWALMFNEVGCKVDFLHFFQNESEWRSHESTNYQTEFCTSNFKKYFRYRN